jgi:hypothetical protein
MRCGTVRVGVAVSTVLLMIGSLSSTGCIRRVRPTPTAAAGAPTAPIPPGEFSAHALPVFRLVTSEVLIDSPSRLVVLQVRLDSDTPYAFDPRNLTVTLPDGSRAQVFDRARAMALLRRTSIAEADFSYLQRDGHAPGGIPPYSRQAIADMVASRLLFEGVFGAGQPMTGYAVVDVGTARMSLDGTKVDVSAQRLADAAPNHSTFVLSTNPAVGAAR